MSLKRVAEYIFNGRHTYKWDEATAVQKGKYRNVAGLAIAAMPTPDTAAIECIRQLHDALDTLSDLELFNDYAHGYQQQALDALSCANAYLGDK